MVEIANFDPVKVRKTGTRLGLRTDAELRFEKNISPKYSLYVLLLFLDELKYYAKSLGNFSIEGIGSYIKGDLNPLAQKSISVNWQEIENLIFGVKIPDFEMKSQKILSDL